VCVRCVGWTFDLAIGYALAVHTIMRARVRASSVECLGRLRALSSNPAFHNSSNISNSNNTSNPNLHTIVLAYLG